MFDDHLRGSPHFDCPRCAQPTVQLLGRDRFALRDHGIQFVDSHGILWMAPIGTETDGGSIPWVAEPLVGKDIDSPLLPGYILHDRYYQLAPPHEASFWAANQSLERRETDRMLLEVAAAVGVSRWRSRLIWHGVRLGGWLPWMRHARYNAKGEN